ncbi:MAG: FAD-dependent monooxygenase [Bacteroidales bacterium]|nr:FAD-dependent monooxygenase [Bacteroidales bacterium]
MDSIQLTLSPQEAHEAEQRYRVVKRSVDARQRTLKVLLTLLLDNQGNKVERDAPIPLYEPPVFQDVHHAKHTAHIIGAGPAGLFAALTLLEHGIRPIIYERGKEVSARKVDIARLNRNQGLNTKSNYCFGEGGAGTFSDGKLFSRSKKRGNMQRVMEWFHYFGAKDNVLYEAHAHIGSDKLPSLIRSMRECIIAHGGEIHFDTCVDNALFQSLTQSDEPIILAIGHSAHDTYRMLAANGVRLEPKGCAMGVRVEHPQSLINRLMYHDQPQEIIDIVGNASYSLVTQAGGRGVYSFCMCPGGHIVPAGSSEESCVVNGMSASRRNSPYANSGIVVEIRPEDVADGPWCKGENSLPTLAFQEWLEHEAFLHGAAESQAPAQRLWDFVEGKTSRNLPPCSYLPGIVSSRLDEWLPDLIGKRLQQGFRDFDRKYRGFLTNEAVILGVESRSSSAVRIPRDPETLQSVSMPNLYPCGEGAGYAGGITSSALDGINAALKIAEKYQ